MDWQLELEKLCCWAEDRGYHVYFQKSGDDCICRITKLIEINSSAKKERQVYHLLHECGHALIFENGSTLNFKMYREMPKYKVGHQVYTVIEEAEAWKRGKKLAQKLNIPIDEELWESIKIKALKKYINWASD